MGEVKLRWMDGVDGIRLLFAGNQTEPVAWGKMNGEGWQFHVLLPGAPIVSRHPRSSRSAGEAFVSGVVEAWFKEINA